MKKNKGCIPFDFILAFATLLLLCGVAAARDVKVKGVINGRSGATMSLQTQDSGNVTVVLTPDTQVLEPEGVFRKKHLAMTALVPGLSVDVKGSDNAANRLVADTVTFHGSDLKTAEDIQAGITPTEQQVQQSQKQIQQTRSKYRHKNNKLNSNNGRSRPSSRRVPSTRQKLRPTKQRLPRRTSASANWVITTSWAR
jgi:OmpA-OmpF porin, OOP family